MLPYLLNPAMCSHVGRRRRNNEDSIGYVYPDNPDILARYGALFIVSDGVGGLAHGEQYSEQAVTLLREIYYQIEAPTTPERLARAIQTVNLTLYERGQGGAATIVAAVFQGDTLTVASAGDSPGYILNPKHIMRLTVDHVIEAPDDTKKKKLFRAMGYESSLSVDTVTGKIKPGMRVLLCSDGITRYYDDMAMLDVGAAYAPADIVERVIRTCYARGAVDNATIMLIEVGTEPSSVREIQQHIGRLHPVVTLPELLPETVPQETLPLFANNADTARNAAGTIMEAAQRKTYHRDDHAVRIAPVREDLAPRMPAPPNTLPELESKPTRPNGVFGSLIRSFVGRKDDMGESGAPELLITHVADKSTSGLIIGFLKRLDTTGIIFEVRATGATIGRRNTCHISIPDDRAVSGEHARLEVNTQGYLMLTNISQTNPVIVNDSRLNQGEQRQIEAGDVIQISPTTRLMFTHKLTG